MAIGALGAVGAGAIGGAGINIVIRAVDKFSATFASVNKGLLAMGAGAIIAGGLIVAGMVKAGQAAAEVEVGFAKVNTLLEEGQDAQELYGKYVADTSILMSYQGDQLDVLSGLYQTISAGISDTAEAQEFMNAATIASIGGSAELSTVIEAGTKAMAGFGLGVEDSTRIFDVFAGTVKAGQTTMGELASAFPKVAGMAGEMGMTIEETAGVFAGLTKVMESSDEVSTSLAAVLTGLLKPTTDMKEAFETLGYESGQAMIQELGLMGTLKELQGTTDGSAEAMGGLFGNVRALRGVMPALGTAAGDVAASIDIVTNSAGLSQKQFEDMTDTVKYQWGVAMSSSKVMLEDIGRVVNKVFVPVLEVLIGWIKKLSEWWMGLSEPMKKIIITVAGIVAGILLLAGTIMILVGLKTLIVGMLVSAATAIWGAVTASLAFVAANIWWIAIIAAVIAVGYLLIKHWDKVKEGVARLGNFITNVFIGIRNIVVKVWNFIIDFIAMQINAIIKLINLLIKGMNLIPGVDIGMIGEVTFKGLKGEMMEYKEYVPPKDTSRKGEQLTVVNIEGNVYGTDPDEMADAIADRIAPVIRL